MNEQEQLDSEVLCQHCGKPFKALALTVDWEMREDVRGVRATCLMCGQVNWFANGRINYVEKPKRKRR